LKNLDTLENALDRLCVTMENSLDYMSLVSRFHREQFGYDGTPFSVCQRVLDVLAITKDDTVIDLGAGYGHFVLAGAATHSAKFMGVELVQERVDVAEKVAADFKLTNAHFVCEDAAGFGCDQGSVFYLFNPFRADTLALVCENLVKVGRQRPIRIAASFNAALALRAYDIFKPLPQVPDSQDTMVRHVIELGLEYFCSQPE